MMNLGFAQAPDLGTSADFVIFTTVGAVTKTGVGFAHLTGNVGSNSGSSTGFGNVNGDMCDGNPQSASATVDLNLAYLEIDGLIPTLFPGLLLGNGTTLTPGIYSSPANTVLNLDLILDGQGDPNALFIFNIEGTFNSNTNAKVKLINGAQACNVFWKVEGQVDLATGTTMRGTIIANNAAINMAVGDTLEGRALSINGAISLDAILAYTPIGCGSPVLTGPIAPDLSSAECYTLFTTIGPCTNVGITNVVGDVGTDLGTTTGFNPLLVVGTIHTVPDGSTAACGVDVLAAHTYVNALPNDIELLYPAQFGNNLVLTPHTYVLNGATAFTDTLYLDAQGDPNAVFVIKIYGALATSVNSKVNFINGTQSQNVYWMVNGAVDINVNSIFRGTIICANGAMSLNTNVYLDGRALTTTGSLTTSAITAIMPLGCPSVSAPIVITDPISQTICDGDSVSFIVSATGTGLTYQWRKGNVNLVDGGNISGATNDTLTIDPATILDAAVDYNVIVSGIYLPSDTSVFVELIVGSTPIITTQPMDQTVCEGNSVSFSVVATGSGLTYQWRKGLVNLINGGTISGATTATLTINPVAFSDEATDYNVVISSCPPNAISLNVSLTVDSLTVITTQPADQVVCPSGSATFSVVATGTNLTYQWRKGLVNLVDGGNISGATTDTLVINPVGLTDYAPNYNVVVTGLCLPAVMSNDAELIDGVTAALASSNSPVCQDSTITLTTPTIIGATYNWTGPNSFSSSDQNPLVPNASPINAGVYTLVVSNGGCTSTPSTVDVVVNDCDSTDFFIPDGFSPNGDGINDLFVIRGIDSFPTNEFVIYNRWGNKVFEATPYQNTWDGTAMFGLTVGGETVPVGTYFYLLDLKDGSPIIKGTIYLNK